MFVPLLLFAADPPAPDFSDFNFNGHQQGFWFTLYPGAEVYTILSSTNLKAAFAPNTNFVLTPFPASFTTNATTNGVVVSTNYNYEWRSTNVTSPIGFYKVQATPMSSNDLLVAHVLNRLAYGPTPDELTRVAGIGPQAYMDEQLAPWDLTEDVESSHTNFFTINARFTGPADYVSSTNASLADFRAWHVLRAVGARRQFLEVLLQFWENHFVTQESKSDSSVGSESNSAREQAVATSFEKLENDRWRAALLNPQCTFLDLLTISAESPAMIYYLDTATSRGDGTRVANENYARELLELFCFGVDNGYDQNDITVMSRAWTGWTVKKVALSNAFNPFAPQTTDILPGSTNTSTTTISNLLGVWAFNYDSSHHNTSSKTIFPAKTVPARFGAPWAGASYQLVLTNGSGTNSIQDGYQVLTHLCNQPFTEEYISVKLCRLLVHDSFPNPVNDPSQTNEYNFYNYAAGNLTPEAQLVHDCMMAWETNSPKGQIWKVLKTITDSDLFRSHSAMQQKVKTPLEFAASTIRALRVSTNGSYAPGTFTADTDGYAVAGTSATGSSLLLRAGTMLLFDRDAPDGYPESAAPWISAGTLCERVRYAQSFCIASGQSGHTGSSNNDAGNSVCNPVQLLLLRTPSPTWTDAQALADYFIGVLFPGEGAANMQWLRDAAVDFLNTDDNGASSPFSGLAVSTSATSSYDQRVRGAVGLMIASPRFQEQ